MRRDRGRGREACVRNGTRRVTGRRRGGRLDRPVGNGIGGAARPGGRQLSGAADSGARRITDGPVRAAHRNRGRRRRGSGGQAWWRAWQGIAGRRQCDAGRRALTRGRRVRSRRPGVVCVLQRLGEARPGGVGRRDAARRRGIRASRPARPQALRARRSRRRGHRGCDRYHRDVDGHARDEASPVPRSRLPSRRHQFAMHPDAQPSRRDRATRKAVSSLSRCSIRSALRRSSWR